MTYTKDSLVRLFANDTIIYLTPSAENVCKKPPRRTSTALWIDRREADWLMEFQSSVIRITRKKTIPHGQTLTEEFNIKYLGVTIADSMMWNTHIGHTAGREIRIMSF